MILSLGLLWVGLAAAGCGTAKPVDEVDEVAAGKADGVALPGGNYRNAMSDVGQMIALRLDDKAFTYEYTLVGEAGKRAGSYRLTRQPSTGKRFLNFYATDNTSTEPRARYAYRLGPSGSLFVQEEGSSDEYELLADNGTCTGPSWRDCHGAQTMAQCDALANLACHWNDISTPECVPQRIWSCSDYLTRDSCGADTRCAWMSNGTSSKGQ
jgi:hypothetical protein